MSLSEISQILSGNTIFYVVNNRDKRNLETVHEYRRNWIMNNNMTNMSANFEYSDEISKTFYNKNAIEKTDVYSHSFVSNTIGSFYEQFSKVYEKEEPVEVEDIDEDENEIMEEEYDEDDYIEEEYTDGEYYEEDEEEYFEY